MPLTTPFQTLNQFWQNFDVQLLESRQQFSKMLNVLADNFETVFFLGMMSIHKILQF